MHYMLAARASTADMRRSIADQVRRWEPGRTVVLKAEFEVRRANEQAVARLLKDLDAAARARRGLAYFRDHMPARSAGEDVVRYETYEEWHTPDAFLEYWDSSDVRDFQQRISQHATSLRVALSKGAATGEAGKFQQVAPLKTGQTDSWDAAGNPRTGRGARDDGDLQTGQGYSTTSRFTENGQYLPSGMFISDGTVTDNLTGLTWLKNANLFGEVPWSQALVNASQLQAGVGGLNDGSRPGDWRMPNVNEMESILDLNKTFGPSLPADAPFTNLEATNYWTSSSVAMGDMPTPLGWFVALAVGPPVFDLKFNTMRMWPVKGRSTRVIRTGQKDCYDPFGNKVDCATAGRGQDAHYRNGVAWPSPRFEKHKKGTVRDLLTGLVWLENADAFGRMSWQDALNTCASLQSGDARAAIDDDSKAGDWRLANLNELRSLIDYSQFGPALPKGHPFSRVQSSLYWSSTTVASAPAFARFVFIGVGPSVWDHKSVLMNVWPCRDLRGNETT